MRCLICALQFDSRANLDKHRVIHWKKVNLTNETEGTIVKSVEDEKSSNRLTFPCCSLVPPGSAPCKGQHSEESVLGNEERREKNPAPESQANVQSIPVISSTQSNHESDQSVRSRVAPRNNRQYNCHDCDFKGQNSKSLLKHVRDTQKTANPHLNHDDLKEQCYTCKEIYANFDDYKPVSSLEMV